MLNYEIMLTNCSKIYLLFNLVITIFCFVSVTYLNITRQKGGVSVFERDEKRWKDGWNNILDIKKSFINGISRNML